MTVLNAQCLLAYEMNIEFVASEKQVGKGHDGKRRKVFELMTTHAYRAE